MISVISILSVLFVIWLCLQIRLMRYRPRQLKVVCDLPEIDGQKFRKIGTHRGYGKRGALPENTLSAFRQSTKEGFKFHELDVRISRNDTPVIFHGPDLATTTDGRGYLENKTNEELNGLNWAAYLKNGKSEPAPWLDQYLKQFSGCITNIELKREWWRLNRPLENKTADAVVTAHCERKVFFSSFNFICLLRIRKYLPDAGVGILIEPGYFFAFRLYLHRLITRPDFIHPPWEEASPKRMQKWRSAGYGIHIWTVDDPVKAEELLKLGADLLITNNMKLPSLI